jgi:dTDP-4-dehydrorhamnose 3,5-epimerase
MVAAAQGARVRAVELSIDGCYLLESPAHIDGRGLFREWYWREALAELGRPFTVAQANISHSTRGAVRGLHYSLAPGGQAKVVTCAYGELDDAIADVRVGSPTFGKVEYLTLSAMAGHSVLVAEGVAHGYCVRHELAAICYLLSSPYNPALELEINPFDESLAVPWRIEVDAVISVKDAAAPTLAERQIRGELPRFGA